MTFGNGGEEFFCDGKFGFEELLLASASGFSVFVVDDRFGWTLAAGLFLSCFFPFLPSPFG